MITKKMFNAVNEVLEAGYEMRIAKDQITLAKDGYAVSRFTEPGEFQDLRTAETNVILALMDLKRKMETLDK